jgi:hypothetical protein
VANLVFLNWSDYTILVILSFIGGFINTQHLMLKALEQRVKELEQIVGKKQIEIDYLEKMIDVAKEELQIDIKKNFNTPQSTGSATTKRK